MPQMMPLMWFMLFLLSIILILMYMITNHSIPTYQINSIMHDNKLFLNYKSLLILSFN